MLATGAPCPARCVTKHARCHYIVTSSGSVCVCTGCRLAPRTLYHARPRKSRNVSAPYGFSKMPLIRPPAQDGTDAYAAVKKAGRFKVRSRPRRWPLGSPLRFFSASWRMPGRPPTPPARRTRTDARCVEVILRLCLIRSADDQTDRGGFDDGHCGADAHVHHQAVGGCGERAGRRGENAQIHCCTPMLCRGGWYMPTAYMRPPPRCAPLLPLCCSRRARRRCTGNSAGEVGIAPRTCWCVSWSTRAQANRICCSTPLYL